MHCRWGLCDSAFSARAPPLCILYKAVNVICVPEINFVIYLCGRFTRSNQYFSTLSLGSAHWTRLCSLDRLHSRACTRSLKSRAEVRPHAPRPRHAGAVAPCRITRTRGRVEARRRRSGSPTRDTHTCTRVRDVRGVRATCILELVLVGPGPGPLASPSHPTHHAARAAPRP